MATKLLTQNDLELTKVKFSAKILDLYKRGKITEEQKHQAFVWYDKHKPQQETLFDVYKDEYADFKRRYHL